MDPPTLVELEEPLMATDPEVHSLPVHEISAGEGELGEMTSS